MFILGRRVLRRVCRRSSARERECARGLDMSLVWDAVMNRWDSLSDWVPRTLARVEAEYPNLRAT